VAGRFRIEALSGQHKCDTFQCGISALDRYFKEQATQDVRRRIANCFVAVDITTELVAGYYTLAATGVALDGLAPALAKKLPRYPVVPAALIGRLAIASSSQGIGLGAALLADAIARVVTSDIGVFAIFVDAKDEPAKRFYEHHGFESLPDHPQRFCLAVATAVKLLK
jgi:GNAT superfamily N-acetyltransferase